MKAATILTTLSTLFLSTQAAVLGERQTGKNTPGRVIAQFKAGTAWNCQTPELQYTSWSYDVVPVGQPGYTAFPDGIRSVTASQISPECLLTVFTQPGSSDPGLNLGVGGCFSSERIYGYKVTCPK